MDGHKTILNNYVIHHIRHNTNTYKLDYPLAGRRHDNTIDLSKIKAETVDLSELEKALQELEEQVKNLHLVIPVDDSAPEVIPPSNDNNSSTPDKELEHGLIFNIEVPTDNYTIDLACYLGNWIEGFRFGGKSTPLIYFPRNVNVNGTLFWGDGSSPVSFNGKEKDSGSTKLRHTYSKAGKYSIGVDGEIAINATSGDNDIETNFYRIVTSIECDSNYNPIRQINVAAFRNLKKLKSISKNLFASLDNKEYPYFRGTFYGCLELKTIPEDLFLPFKGKIKFFYGREMFNYTGLTELPQRLFWPFSDTIEYINIIDCFRTCESIAKIPNDFLPFPNIKAAYISGLFCNCSKLVYIPEGLLEYIVLAEGRPEFIYENGYIVSFTINKGEGVGLSSIFCNTAITSIPDLFRITTSKFNHIKKTMYDFDDAFLYCNKIKENLPDYWNIFPICKRYRCFYGCTNAPNYSLAVWKGWALGS